MSALLEVEGLRKHFPIAGGGAVRAVDGVDLRLEAGRTLALVGESGCGKSTVGRCTLRLIEPDAGSLRFEGQDLRALSGEDLRRIRPRMQMVFQDPASSLNPRMQVERLVGEAVEVHGLARGSDLKDKVEAIIRRVGLQPEHLGRLPHELSGGQRQRVGIARALALDPRLIVCDEAVSALDVSVQAQVLNLLAELQQERGLAYLFIAHDLAVVRHLSQRVAVMYLGRIVEEGSAEQVFGAPRHPYTQALLAAVPRPRPGPRPPRAPLRGEPPSPSRPPSGCAFHPRCPLADARCAAERPAPQATPEGSVACHRVAEGKIFA